MFTKNAPVSAKKRKLLIDEDTTHRRCHRHKKQNDDILSLILKTVHNSLFAP